MSDYYKRTRGDYKSSCRSCHDKDGTRRRNLYKKQAVAYKGGQCQAPGCGYKRNQAVLEFHHNDPSKKDFSLSQARRSFESSKPELDKCTMFCVNCHREEHAKLLVPPPVGLSDPLGPQCGHCRIHKVASEFTSTKKQKSLPWCTYCKVMYQRENRREIKQEIVDYKGGCCQMCSYSRCLDALEFHHLDPSQKDLGIAVLRRRLAKIKSEVDKCVLWCGNCHREYHSGVGPTHLI